MNNDRIRREIHQAVEQVTQAAKADPWLAQRIRARAQGKDAETARRKISAGTVLIVILIVLSVSVGIAAVSGWDVVQFLYGSRSVQRVPEMDVFPLHLESASDGALFRVDSAVYDGRILAFDWHFENTGPETPICGCIEEFTVNGIPVSGEGGDTFESLWLPCRRDPESIRQSGERVILPAELRDAENLHVFMKITVYRPNCPVYEMETFDPDEAGRKTEEGYFVIAEGEGFVEYDPDEKQWTVFLGTDNTDGRLRETTLEISFDITKGENGYHALKPAESYENEHCTALYSVAAITPGGLNLTLQMDPKDDYESRITAFVLTDGDGTALEGEKYMPDVSLKVNAGSGDSLVYRYRWSLVRRNDLPDTVSLSCILENGERLVFPVKVR